MEEISLSSIELPAAKNSGAREKEDNGVEAEKELEEVTSMLTSR